MALPKDADLHDIKTSSWKAQPDELAESERASIGTAFTLEPLATTPGVAASFK